MTSELKPCPFCGGGVRHRLIHGGAYSEDLYAICCKSCNITMETESTLTEQDISSWNTRAVPDVPELVRYSGKDICSDLYFCRNVQSSDDGEYVLHSQAAEMLAAKDKEIEEWRDITQSYATKFAEASKRHKEELAQYEAQKPFSYLEASLLVDQAFKFWAEKPHNRKWFKRIDGTPIPNDLCSVISEQVAGIYASPAPAADLKAENERLRGALDSIIERSHNDPLGTSKVVDMRNIAVAALSGKEPS